MDTPRPERRRSGRYDDLWRLIARAHQLGELRSFNLPDVGSFLSEQGVHLDPDEFHFVHRRLARETGQFATPPWLARFVATMLASRSVHAVLDPCAGQGVFTADVAAGVETERFDAVTQTPEAMVVRDILGTTAYTLHTGDWQAVQQDLLPSYDALVSVPPIGHRPGAATLETPQGAVEVRDDPSLVLLLRAASHLSAKGLVLWLVPPSFAWDTRARSVRRNLDRFGLHLRALLELPPGSFTGISLRFSLALIDRQEHSRLYVAEIPEDVDGQQQLIERIRRSKQGPTPAQGRLVDPSGYRGLEEQTATEAIGRMARGAGMKRMSPADAIVSVSRLDGQGPVEPEEPANAIYLGADAFGPAYTSRSQLPWPTLSYYQVVLDPDVALAEYVAAQLSTAFGRSTRLALARGASRRRFGLDDLQAAALYLPPVDRQREAVGVLSTLRSMQIDLAGLEAQIWEGGDSLRLVRDSLATYNHDDLFAEWIETLPYPLAAILRTYRVADDSNEKRCRRLGHFFEALAEFVATLHISAWRGRSGLWDERRAELGPILEEAGLSWEKPSFGLWLVVVQNLSKRTRAQLAKPDTGALCLSWYSALDAQPLEAISSQALVEILARTCHFRNTWLGHGGEPTEEEWGERLTELEADLEAFRACVGRTFVEYRLLRVGPADVRPGPVYDYKVHVAMGSNPQLETRRVTLVDAVTSGRLCLQAPQSTSALPLVQLVKIEETQQPAAYFFSRVTPDGLDYVSYQVAAHSAISSKADDVVDLIGEFSGAGDDGAD